MQRMERHQALVPGEFRYYSGDDFTMLEFLKLGGHGVVTVTGNVAPGAVSDMCRAVAAGEIDEAAAIDVKLQPLNAALFAESNPIPVKWALQRMGMISSSNRLPLTVYAEEFHDQMIDAMNIAGIEIGGQA
jgi:dihydrodipicolinate synthase/N-acetylneuraminate lyase